MQVYPPPNILVSRGQARTLLARLRALQEASGMYPLTFEMTLMMASDNEGCLSIIHNHRFYKDNPYPDNYPLLVML